MTTIKIKKSDLIKELSTAVEYFGSTDWDIYVSADGSVDTRHNTYSTSGWDEIIDLYYLGDYSDENDNIPGDENYDARGVAEWLVNETDLTLSDIERYNTENGEFETVNIELV